MTGLGRDTWCADVLRPGRLVTGQTLLAQACYRRLITPRGALRGGDEEGAYGLDVAGYAGALGDAAALALPAAVENELLKDDRVASVRVEATRSVNAGAETLTLTIDVVPADESEEFRLTLGIDEGVLSVIGGLP